MLPAPTGASEYAGSEIGGPVRHGNGNYPISEYSYGGLNPVYNPSVSGSQAGYYHTNGNYYQASTAASEFGAEFGAESSKWLNTQYAGSNVSYNGQQPERPFSPSSPGGPKSPKSPRNNYS
jgi:hypothetical protein